MLLTFPAANHDPAAFDAPDQETKWANDRIRGPRYLPVLLDP